MDDLTQATVLTAVASGDIYVSGNYCVWLYITACKDAGVTTVWRKCLTGENFDKFDEWKLNRQNFPYQYFTFQ